MLLLLGIGLAIAAWCRGWHGWALVPLAIDCALAFLIGSAVFSTYDSGDEEIMTFAGLVILIDLGAIVALIIMIAKPRGQTATLIHPEAPSDTYTGNITQTPKDCQNGPSWLQTYFPTVHRMGLMGPKVKRALRTEVHLRTPKQEGVP